MPSSVAGTHRPDGKHSASSDPALDKNRNDAVTIVAAIAGDTSTPGDASMFIGDQQGFGSMLEVLNPAAGHKSQHYTIPRSKENSLDSDDLTYLKSKGCFALPSQEVCDQLIKTYFHHVHPLLPILDAKAVLEPYTTVGIQNVDLLLLWSMFSISASVSTVKYSANVILNDCQFVDMEFVVSAGFNTRKEMKQSMYRRGKVGSPLLFQTSLRAH